MPAYDRIMDNALLAEEITLQEEASYHEFTCALRLTAPMSGPTVAEDVESLKRLILEKEKDLELAARIGQSLLTKNRLLQINHDELTQLFTVTQDELTQLRHELSMNKELLRIYSLESSDYDGRDDYESEQAVSTFKHVQMLQARIRFLEDENNRLRQEAKELSVEAADFETKETEIIHGCVRELAETHAKLQTLTENLKQKTEENLALSEETEALLSQMVDLQARANKACRENEEVKASLDIYKEGQSQLATELIGLQDKYEFLSSHAESLEEELRKLRRKDTYIQTWADGTSSFSHLDSLAAELDHSIFHAYNSVGSAEDAPHDDQYRRVIEIARLANQPASLAHTITTSVNPSNACITSVGASSRSSIRKSSPSRPGRSECLDPALGSYFGKTDLHRLPTELSSLVTNDEGICDRTFLGTASCDSRNCATPDSALGAGSDAASYHNRSGFADVSCRLQLVKQMEGSQLLSRWKQLASTPCMNSFIDDRPGILTKGQNAESDQLAAREMAARRGSGASTESFNTTVLGPTVPKLTFTSSKIDHSSETPSIFSVGALKLNRAYGMAPVFPHPTESFSTASELKLAQVLRNTTNPFPSHCDPPLDLPDDNDPETEASRSRRTSGSLSSASRSPSPVRQDLTPTQHARSSIGFFQPVLQTMYANGRLPSVRSPGQCLQMLSEKSVHRSRNLISKPV